ncbi:hypothetical protein WICPIJ_004588 [Wickerhamomyces pijperi]|uniref:Bul1 N-terminal domain-containing protein n=1 Tax=Wickerhamomyces pijperi TaxID=599730 RepID=A0A9P8TN53_WICPI|nr:hypothetical protein WICPIJ_004588 [Wickerhamomyces pijperi]
MTLPNSKEKHQHTPLQGQQSNHTHTNPADTNNVDNSINESPVLLTSASTTSSQPSTPYDDPIFQKNVYFDVLPSFEMYHFLQYHTPANTEDDTPPLYTPSLLTCTDSSSCERHSTSVVNGTSSSTMGRSNSSVNGTSSTLFNTAAQSDYFSKNIVDNYQKLPEIDHKGISITIKITKNLPGPHTTNETESILKEYTSGDIVHGFAVIENKSAKRIPFRAFFVTLEGLSSVIDTKSKKMVQKKFLVMVDLSATWSSSSISSSAVNQEFVCGAIDRVDGCAFGLPDDRFLKPGMKYKKFFTFKLPYNVLDDRCLHDQNLHLLLPPSLGVNKLYKRGKYAHIQIDPMHKYGHKSVPGGGGPVAVDDMTNGLISIDYTINALFIDDQAPECKSQLTVIKHREHFLRFVPFGFSESSLSSKLVLQGFKGLVEMNLRNCQNFLEGDVKTKLSISQQTATQAQSCSSGGGPIQLPVRNSRSDPAKIVKYVSYQSNPSSSGSSIFGFSKSKKAIRQTIAGALTISTNIPQDSLPYIRPPLIKRNNKRDNTNSKAETKIIDQICLDLKFETNCLNGSALTLPELKDVSLSLLAVNIYSNGSIPIKLSHDILLDQQDETGNDLLSSFKSQFADYFQKYDEYEQKFKELEVPIESHFDKNLHKDLQAIKDLKFDCFAILNLFQVERPSSKQQQQRPETEWRQTSPTCYTKKIVIDFTLTRDQIKETLVPSFQSCLITRSYYIKVSLVFKTGMKTSLKIPVRVR